MDDQDDDQDPPIFTAVSSSVRQLYLLLRCIGFAEKANVQITEEGLRFSVEETSVMEGLTPPKTPTLHTPKLTPNPRLRLPRQIPLHNIHLQRSTTRAPTNPIIIPKHSRLRRRNNPQPHILHLPPLPPRNPPNLRSNRPIQQHQNPLAAPKPKHRHPSLRPHNPRNLQPLPPLLSLARKPPNHHPHRIQHPHNLRSNNLPTRLHNRHPLLPTTHSRQDHNESTLALRRHQRTRQHRAREIIPRSQNA